MILKPKTSIKKTFSACLIMRYYLIVTHIYTNKHCCISRYQALPRTAVSSVVPRKQPLLNLCGGSRVSDR